MQYRNTSQGDRVWKEASHSGCNAPESPLRCCAGLRSMVICARIDFVITPCDMTSPILACMTHCVTPSTDTQYYMQALQSSKHPTMIGVNEVLQCSCSGAVVVLIIAAPVLHDLRCTRPGRDLVTATHPLVVFYSPTIPDSRCYKQHVANQYQPKALRHSPCLRH
jgi:hypothetical protein